MLERLGFPAVGEHRRFVAAIAVDTIGGGLFMPVSVLYFLAVTDLTLVQIGAAISVASLIALPVTPLLGSIVDRWGARATILWANVLQAAGFVAYLFTDSYWSVLAWTVVVSLGRAAFFASYGNIVTAISAPGEREKWFGFLGSVRNIGYAAGGLLAGLAVSLDSVTAYQVITLANAVSFLVSLVLLLDLPRTRRVEHAEGTGSWGVVLRDRPYLLLWVLQLLFACSMMVLNFAFPVYAVTVLGLPGWVTGAVFTINTVMVGFGQGLVVRAITGRLRWRILVAAQAFFAAGYVVMLVAGRVGVVAGTVAMLAGAIVYSLGELVGNPVHAAVAAESAPDHLRGRYLSLIQLSWGISGTIAPVAYLWLLDQGRSPLWLVMIGVTVTAAALAILVGRILPRAGQPITNQAEPAGPSGSLEHDPL
jgi:MFS family permease